ncbi:MAG TPA: hypothetical protein VJ625_04350 [Propionibacteriaceae bacterium]|nr:hypothetical protein [Propionibacteriaceae bacterium]
MTRARRLGSTYAAACFFHGRIEAGEDRFVAVQQVDQLSRREREAAVEPSDGAEMPRIRPVLDPIPTADR